MADAGCRRCHPREWEPVRRGVGAGAYPAGWEKLDCGILEVAMRHFTAVVERDPDTGLYVGYVPGFPGAHSQGETLDELNLNLREVIEMLMEDDDVLFEAEFVGTQQIVLR